MQERTPHHPHDALTIAAAKATLIGEVGVQGPNEAHVLDWLEMFGRLGGELADEIDRVYPRGPFDAEMLLSETMWTGRSLWALYASTDTIADEEGWHRNTETAIYLCGQLSTFAKRLRAALEQSIQESQESGGGDNGEA